MLGATPSARVACKTVAAPTCLEQARGWVALRSPSYLPPRLARREVASRGGRWEGPVDERGGGPRTPGVAPRPDLPPMLGGGAGRTRSPSTVAGRGRYPGPSDLPSRGGADAPVPLQAPSWVSLVWDNPPQPPRTPTPPGRSLASQRGGLWEGGPWGGWAGVGGFGCGTHLPLSSTPASLLANGLTLGPPTSHHLT